MSKLYFKIGSDWEEVVRLRNEIAKLKQELMSMDGTQSPAAFKALNAQLAASNQRLDELVTNAAKAGAEMETGFKRKIFDASQAVNPFTAWEASKIFPGREWIHREDSCSKSGS